MNAWHLLGLIVFLVLCSACSAMADWADEARAHDAAEERKG